MVLELKRQEEELIRSKMFFIDNVPYFHCACGHVVKEGGFVLVHDKLEITEHRGPDSVEFRARRPAEVVCRGCAEYWTRNLDAYVDHIKSIKERAEIEKGGEELVTVVSVEKGDQS